MQTSSYVPPNGNSLSFSDSQRGRTNSRKRIRMSRCGQCVGCNASNCGKCYKCLDMIKYGGPGTLKQACERRQCVNPQMPGVAPLTTPIQYSANSSKGSYNKSAQLQLLMYLNRIYVFDFRYFLNSLFYVLSTWYKSAENGSKRI